MTDKPNHVEARMDDMQNIVRVFTHDLRNPLLNIQALVQDLDEQASTMSLDVTETLSLLQQSVRRMDDMILAANDMYHCMFDELEIEELDMHELFLRCFASLKLAEEGIAMDCSAMPSVKADPLMVQRIVLELLSNAKKAMAVKPFNRQRDIFISTVTDADMIWFCVEDSGCGFISNEMDKVFEPFFSGQCFVAGSGMGLTRAKALVEHQGGQISVENVEQHAVVGFSLPKSKKPTD